jgi:hypothetical protein
MGGLFGSTVLDVAIGLIFIYLLLSIICTAANEWIAGMTKSRAKLLEKSIAQLLGSQATAKTAGLKGFLSEFDEHPLIKGMKAGKKLPTYISGRVFAKVVMDLATPDKPGTLKLGDFETEVKKMPDGNVKTTLLAAIADADGRIDSARRAIEGWFEDAMDRASGWYKRKTQLWTVLVAAFIIVAANADTVRMTQRLWTNPELRAAVVEGAKTRAQQPRPSVDVQYPDPDNPDNPVVTPLDNDELISEKDRALLGQVLGWQADAKDEPKSFWARWPQRILGWLLTLLAVSLGAPFWFDLLNKFIHIRSAGKSPDEAAKAPEKKKRPPQDKTA